MQDQTMEESDLFVKIAFNVITYGALANGFCKSGNTILTIRLPTENAQYLHREFPPATQKCLYKELVLSIAYTITKKF